MKGAVLTIISALVIFACYGQNRSNERSGGTVLGKIIDSATRRPIDYATISIYRAGKSTPLNGTTSDSTGAFTLTNIPAGHYEIVIEFVGYRTITLKDITIAPSHEVVDLKQILLGRNYGTLQGVVVTAQGKLVENKIDKLVYNAEKDITSQTGVATDLLRKVPGLSVDVDGNVELQGSGNILFLINGKPSTIFGSNITDVLQAIPANQIKSIEVITNPGAKYDAQGTGGIINIILKHSTIQGISGNVSLTAGTLVNNGSLNINARKGKFGINAFVDGNARLTTTTPSSFKRISTDTAGNAGAILQQDGSTGFNRHGFQAGVVFDWSPNESSSLSGGVNYHHFGNKSNGKIQQVEQIEGGGVFSETRSNNLSTRSFRQDSWDPSVNYRHNFKNKEQQLEITLDGSFTHNTGNSGSDQYLEPQDSLVYGTRNNNPAIEREYEAKVDYVQPLRKEVNLGVGGKFSGYDILSTADASLWDPAVGLYLYNIVLSNDLNYHQKVYAGYTELSFPVSKSIEARLGGRYERTQVHSFYANAHQTIDNGYNTLIPSIFLMKKISETQTIKLNFTIRINRPDYGDLNPFINTSDPKNITTGNPNLKPEVWDRYEASYNQDLGKVGSYMITLFYRQSNGDIQPFIVYYPSLQVGDTTYTYVAVTTRENIGIEENLGTNLYVDLHAGEKFNIRSNTIFFYRHTINQVNPGYNSTATIGRFTVNAAYQFSGNSAGEFFGGFNSRHHEAQGYYPSFISYSVALRKQFWNKKGSLALSANNFLSNYVDQRTQLYGPGFVSTSLRRIPYRSIGLNFTWKFGGLVVKKENSEDHTIDLSAPQQ